MEHTNHVKTENGWTCKRTGEHTNFVYWRGTSWRKESEDICKHCGQWTIGGELAKLETKRRKDG